jgi:cell division septal protein FtsQ
MKKKFINKRKKNFLYEFKFTFIFLLILILLSVYLFLNSQKFFHFTIQYVEKYSIKYNYILTNIEVSNLKYLDQKDILSYFEIYKGSSIFLIPMTNISNEIIQNKWIKSIKINSNYLNTINIEIIEEIPFGIYDNENQKLLFSSDLVILEIIKDKDIYSDLITFYGEDSMINSKEFLGNLNYEFKKMIDSAFFINKRRWNILLDNMILLKLSEIDIKNSIKDFIKLYTNFSSRDLEKIESIDLRIKNQAIIKYKKTND